MSDRTKLISGVIAAALALALAPIACSALRTYGYFDGGRCACGKNIYIHLTHAGYFTYSPGHGVPEHQVCALRPNGNGWDLLALPSPPDSWAPTKAGEVVGRVRLQSGTLYSFLAGSTNWTPHARIYNPWPIWTARALKQ